MRLSREKFHFRGICIRIFSFLCMIYSWEWTKQSEEEISQAEGSCVFESPLASSIPRHFIPGLLHQCVRYTSIHTFAISCGASKCGPFTAPSSLAESLQINLHKHVIGRLSKMDRRAVTQCCGMIMAAGSIHAFPGSKQNNRHWVIWLTLPWVIQGIVFTIIFWIHTGERFLLCLQNFAKSKMCNLCDLSLYDFSFSSLNPFSVGCVTILLSFFSWSPFLATKKQFLFKRLHQSWR